MGWLRARGRARAVEAWSAWTRPSKHVTDRTASWRARLLASLMLAAVPLGVLMTFAVLATGGSWQGRPWWSGRS
ncbi:MAG: hypothetical protein K0V04_39490, partial [Deltaproteobacteria bacterium]|nr:hypothetical protein [Deltaproteobacteria bacterium]